MEASMFPIRRYRTYLRAIVDVALIWLNDEHWVLIQLKADTGCVSLEVIYARPVNEADDS
jgi:hypothetical protein